MPTISYLTVVTKLEVTKDFCDLKMTSAVEVRNLILRRIFSLLGEMPNFKYMSVVSVKREIRL